MECHVRWTDHMTFVAETGSGHKITMDGPPDLGGRNLGPRPMEMMLAGAGGCSAFDVVLILQRGRHPVSGCEVLLKAERAKTDPKVFTKLHLHYIVTGNALKQEAVERAVTLSKDKYCSATAMLGATAEITWDLELRQSESTPTT